MARIYISSTFADLEGHRKAVSLALRRLRHEDVAMEYYLAEEKRPLDRCLQDIDGCDAYVGVFAWRYGYVPTRNNPEGLSITHQEFRRAVADGKPCFIFLLNEETPWPPGRVDQDRTAITALRAEVGGEDRVADFFKSEDELARHVTEALAEWTRRSGLGASYTRSDFAAYRDALVERHQWVRLQVIAGVGKERGPIRVPLTQVFEPQLVSRGASSTKLAGEIRRYQEFIYGLPAAAATDDAEDGGDGNGQIAFGASAAQDEDADGAEQPLSATEQVFDVLGKERTQVILGGPGSGKSTLLQFVMLKAAQLGNEDLAAASRFLSLDATPFLVELRKYTLSKDADFVTHISNQSKELYGADLTSADINELLRQPRGALVFFDGLDEIFDPDDRRRVVDQFQTFARTYSEATIVVTSRIAGYDPESLSLADFEHYTLMPLTIAHIRNFADHWYRYYSLEGTERTAQGLVQRIIDSPRLLDLAGNPLLLTMMAVIYKDRDLPVERWRLYERCADTLLEDWDILKGYEDEDFKLAVLIKTAQKSEILQLVADKMLQGRESGAELNAIGYTGLLDLVADYLQQKYQRSAGEASAIAVDILRHLMERTYVLAGIGERAFGFVHRTFMEYFAACSCQAQFNAKRSDFNWLNDQIFGAHWHEPEWQEVLLLLIAMLHDQGTPIHDVIERLRGLGTGQAFPYHVAFAARCLGEAGAVQDQEQAVSVLDDLAEAIAEHAPKSKNSDAQAFVESGLAAFASLASEVEAGLRTRAAIRSLDEAGPVTARSAAWQMNFALLPRKERLAFALNALADREEVVRRGAIAVLEREWPGRHDVGPALASVVEQDRQARVRLAAIVAIQRAWHDEPALLDAIARRLPTETAFTVVVRMLDYLGSAWPADDRALGLVLALMAHQPRGPSTYSRPDVIAAGAEAIRRGWAGDPAALILLKVRVTDELDPTTRAGYLTGIARGWAHDPEAFGYIRRNVGEVTNMAASQGLLEAIATSWAGDAEALLFLQETVDAADDVENAIGTLRSISAGWAGNKEALRFMQQRATRETDANILRELLGLIAEGWTSTPDALTYLKQRVNEDPPVRALALQAITRAWATDPAVQLYLQRSAQEHPDPNMRAEFLRAIAGGWFHANASDFLEQRFVVEPDPTARAAAHRGLLFRALSEPVWSDAAALHQLFRRILSGLQDRDDPVRQVSVENSPYAIQYADYRFQPAAEPETLTAVRDLILEIAGRDPNPDLRLRALDAVAVLTHSSSPWQVPSTRAPTRDVVASSRAFVEDAMRTNPDSKSRRIALWVLCATGDDQEILAILKARAVDDPDPDVRLEAMRVLAWTQRHPSDTKRFLGRCAESDTENARGISALLVQITAGHVGRSYLSDLYPWIMGVD